MIMYKAMLKLKVGDTIFCMRQDESTEDLWSVCRFPFEIAPALVLRIHGSKDARPLGNTIDIAWKDTGMTHRIGAERCFETRLGARDCIVAIIHSLQHWLGVKVEQIKVAIPDVPPPLPLKLAKRSHKEKARHVTRGR